VTTPERRRHSGVAQIDFRRLSVGVRLLHVGAPGVTTGARLVEICLSRDILGLELLLAREFRLRVEQRSLGAFLRRLRLLQLYLVWLRLDYEERSSFLHERAVLIFDLLKVALHSRNEFYGVHGCGIAGGLQVRRDRPLHGRLHGDLRRGRRHELILATASRCCEAKAQTGEEQKARSAVCRRRGTCSRYANTAGKVSNWWVYQIMDPRRGTYRFSADLSFRQGDKGFYAVLQNCRLAPPNPEAQ
jgi:hypothetical protein